MCKKAMEDVNMLAMDIRGLILQYEIKTGLKVRAVDIDKLPHTTAVTVVVTGSHTIKV